MSDSSTSSRTTVLENSTESNVTTPGNNTSTALIQTTLTSLVTDLNETTTSSTTWSTTVNSSMSECITELEWISDRFGDCVESPVQVFAFSVGMIAIGLWMIAHLLLFKSYRDDPDCSCTRLTLIFLAGLGSVFNLVGATLSDQLGTQVLTACFLVFSDVVFLIQWIHWWNKNRKLNKQGLSFYVASDDSWKSPDRTREENAMNGGGAVALCVCIPCFVTIFYVTLPWQQSYTDHAAMSTGGRKLLMVSESATDNFGYAMGFTTLLFYSLCKIPTMINIVKHKVLFKESLHSHVLLILANASYFISIVAFDTDPMFLANAIPWLLTSLSMIGLSSIIICLVMRNRGVGPNNRPVSRRRTDGAFLLYPSEESLNSDLERAATLRFTDDAASIKLPSIQEEPHLENNDQQETEVIPDDVDDDDGFDVETASIHSRASDFILDDDEDVYVRTDEDDDKRSGKGRRTNFDDDGLEWDFDDFRPRYTESDDDIDNGIVKGLTGSPSQHHSFGVPQDDDWDEERVLNEIERELELGDDVDGDTISMEYDTAEDDEQVYQGAYSYVSHSQ